MVVFGILKKALPLAFAGLALFAVANIITKPAQASQTAGAIGQTFGALGGGLGALGSGVSTLFTGFGQGTSALLDPLFRLKSLFGGEAESDQLMVLQQNQQTASSTSVRDPVVNTASDQPGVTPQAPASSTVNTSLAGGGFTATNFFGGSR